LAAAFLHIWDIARQFFQNLWRRSPESFRQRLHDATDVALSFTNDVDKRLPVQAECHRPPQIGVVKGRDVAIDDQVVSRLSALGIVISSADGPRAELTARAEPAVSETLMGLSYVYKAPATASPLRHPSGRSYALGANNVVTIPFPDGFDPSIALQGTLLYLTGATADRPSASQYNIGKPGTAFLDTSLSQFVFYAPGLSATNWCDQNGAAA
jgi:hypothetical protein